MRFRASSVGGVGSRRGIDGSESEAGEANQRDLRTVLVAVDATAITLAWAAVLLLATDLSLGSTGFLASVASVVTLAAVNAQGLHRSRVCCMRTVELARSLAAVGLAGILFALAEATLSSDMGLPLIAMGSVSSFLALVIGRSAFRAWLSQQRAVGQFTRSVLLIGTNAEARHLLGLVSRHPELGIEVVGVLGNPAEAAITGIDLDLLVGPVAAVDRELARSGASGVLIAVSALRNDELNQLIRKLSARGVHVQLTNGLQGIGHRRLRSQVVASEPLYYVESVHLALWQKAVKVAVDLSVATLVVVATAPVLVPTVLVMSLFASAPVLIRELRVGAGGRLITITRIRTTRPGGAGISQNRCSVWIDPDLTKIGRILEITSLNEIPQLWSVLRGHLSLVGPRPPLPAEVSSGLVRLPTLRPGITGLWKIEDRGPVLDDHARLDEFYIENYSIALDLVVLAATIEPILARLLYGASSRRCSRRVLQAEDYLPTSIARPA